MGNFLAELGKKLAERWLTLLVLPGSLFLSTLTVALILGWSHAFDAGLLISRLNSWSTSHLDKSSVFVLFLLAVLLFSAGVGLAAQALGAFIAQLWLAENWYDWPPVVRSLAQRRKECRMTRWEQARKTYESVRGEAGLARARARIGIAPEQPADLTRYYHRLLRISPVKPHRPTWIGDRVYSASSMLQTNYNLDLPTVWPALSLILPETVYQRIEKAGESYQQAAALAGWGILYLIPAIFWVPALVIPLVAWVAAHRSARTAVDSYYSLVEACVAIHGPELARALGIEDIHPFTRSVGRIITHHLQGRTQ